MTKINKLAVFSILAACTMTACGNDTNSSTNEKPESKFLCGDGTLGTHEVCDASAQDGIWATCSDFDDTKTWEPGGQPGCSPDCMSYTQGTCIEKNTNTCGNQKLEPTEKCDGDLGLADACSAFDNSVTWSGGKPGCSSTCDALTIGTCYRCGDGIKNKGETCDGTDGIPASCEAWDNTKEWAEGSYIACDSSCNKIDYSHCVEKKHEFVFMNWNVLFGGIDCFDSACWEGDHTINACIERECKDKNFCSVAADWTNVKLQCLTESLKITCANEHWFEDCNDPSIDYRNECYRRGRCTDFDMWGGTDVIPRVQRWAQIVSKYPVKPDVISIVETSGDWHSGRATGEFKKLGYAWVDNTLEPDTHSHYLSNILYKTDKYELLDHGVVRLLYDESDPHQPESYGGRPLGAAKAISMYAVLKEKETGEIFIPGATHWDANNIWDPVKNSAGEEPNKIQNIFGWIISHELNRVRGARDTAAKLMELKAQYPNAHFVYGGDFNTIDFDILFNSNIPKVLDAPIESIADLLNTLIGKLVKTDIDIASIITGTLSLSNMPALIKTFNLILGDSAYPHLPADFVGSHQEFADRTGFTDARSYALENIPDTEDTWSTSEQALADYESAISNPDIGNLSLVIDYAFFSQENLDLTSYKVMTHGDGVSKREDYMFVSDHFPVRTTYTYTVSSVPSK